MWGMGLYVTTIQNLGMSSLLIYLAKKVIFEIIMLKRHFKQFLEFPFCDRSAGLSISAVGADGRNVYGYIANNLYFQ